MTARRIAPFRPAVQQDGRARSIEGSLSTSMSGVYDRPMDHLEDWHSFNDTPWSSLPDDCPGRLPIGPEPDALHATCCDQASRQVPRDGQLTIANLTCHKWSLEHGFRRGCSKSRETLTVRCALFTRARRHVIWRYRPPHLRNMCIRKRASDSTTPLSAELGSLCLRTCRGVAN